MSADPLLGAELRVIKEFDDFLELHQAWDGLFEASATRSATLRFEWLAQWWRVYGPVYGNDAGMSVITVWRGARLVGALPLYRRLMGRFVAHARLQFISTGEKEFEETCPEYMDVLMLPGEEACVVAALRWAFSGDAMLPWDDLLLLDVAQSCSPLVALVQDLGPGCSVEVASRGVSMSADLHGGFEAYLARLSPNSRQQARRVLRAAQQAGAVLEVVTDPAEIDPAFNDLVRLHQARWAADGEPGCFGAPRFAEFHRALARALVPDQRALLARLNLGGQPLAVIYGFLTAGKFDFYQSGVQLDGHHKVKRPGITAHLLLMSYLANQGVTCYDFLRGNADYKRRLSTGERPLALLRVVRLTARSATWAAAIRLRRAARRAVNAVVRIAGGTGAASSLDAMLQLCHGAWCVPALVCGAIV